MSPGSVYEVMDDGNKKPAEVNPRLSTESEGAFGGGSELTLASISCATAAHIPPSGTVPLALWNGV
jgi:hypothetical protein